MLRKRCVVSVWRFITALVIYSYLLFELLKICKSWSIIFWGHIASKENVIFPSIHKATKHLVIFFLLHESEWHSGRLSSIWERKKKKKIERNIINNFSNSKDNMWFLNERDLCLLIFNFILHGKEDNWTIQMELDTSICIIRFNISD